MFPVGGMGVGAGLQQAGRQSKSRGRNSRGGLGGGIPEFLVWRHARVRLPLLHNPCPCAWACSLARVLLPCPWAWLVAPWMWGG